MLGSEKKQTILIEAFKEIGICRKIIKVKSMVIKDGLVFNAALFVELNLFTELRFFNLMLESNSMLILVV